VVDTETTGVDPDKDAIIELGMVLFEFDPATGSAYRVLGSFDQLEDPGFPIPPESTSVHGITDEMVAGRRIDDAGVAQFLDGVSWLLRIIQNLIGSFLRSVCPCLSRCPGDVLLRRLIGVVKESVPPSWITSLTNMVFSMRRIGQRVTVCIAGNFAAAASQIRRSGAESHLKRTGAEKLSDIRCRITF